MTTVNQITQSVSPSTRHYWLVRWFCVFVLLGLLGLISSCGFTLRGQQLPNSALSHLHVEQPARRPRLVPA